MESFVVCSGESKGAVLRSRKAKKVSMFGLLTNGIECLFITLLKEVIRVIVTINDFFLKDNAPKTLGTRIIATMVLQATKIPGFDSITASATRWFYPIEGDELSREVIGYYFFPRLGFNADPKNADDYVDIPEKIKGKKLLQIMRNPDLRQWWKGNGQTIDVKFKVTDKRSLKALAAYLTEKRIRVSTGE